MSRVKLLNKQPDLCSRPLLGKIITFSLPLLATGILQLLYNAADIIVVGQFAGEDAMAAVGSTSALVNLIINLFIGLSIGALASTARYIGSKDAERVEKIVHTSIVISILGGIFLAIFGFFMSEFFLKLMGTPDKILPLSTLYLKIFFIGMPFNLLYNFGASILRATGDTKRPLIILTIAGIINVALNLLFVITFKMSVAGVAIATVVSQAFSAVIIFIFLVKKQGYGKIYIKKLRIDKRALIDIMKVGIPAGIQGTIFSFSNVIIQSSVNAMGNVAMAGNAAAASVEGFIYVGMNSISQATLTFAGQNYGAQKKENINLVIFQTITLATLIGLIMGIGACLLGTPLLSLYNENPAVIESGLHRLYIIASTYFLCGIMEVLVGALRGLGKSVGPMIVSIIGVCGIRIVWIFTVYAALKTPLTLYLSYPVSWIATSLIQFIYLLVVKKKLFARFVKPDINLPPPNQSGQDSQVDEITEVFTLDENVFEEILI